MRRKISDLYRNMKNKIQEEINKRKDKTLNIVWDEHLKRYVLRDY